MDYDFTRVDKTIYSSLSEPKLLCLVKVTTLRHDFQQSTVRSVTLTLTFPSLSIPESQFFQHFGIRPAYGVKTIADCGIWNW
jgi:hypothetical protein